MSANSIELPPFTAYDANGRLDTNISHVSHGGRIDTADRYAGWGLTLLGTRIIKNPPELDGHIGYNPSGIGIEIDADGEPHYVFGKRVELDEHADHIGTTRTVLCEIDPAHPEKEAWLYKTEKSMQRDRAMTEPDNAWNRRVDPAQRKKRFYAEGMVGFDGEDMWMKRVWVEENGLVVAKWQVGATYAWGKWDENHPEQLQWQERTWLVDRLEDLHPGLPPHSIGPMYEKDIRRLPYGDGTRGFVAGRPQPTLDEGMISGFEHDDIAHVTADQILGAPKLGPSVPGDGHKLPKNGSNYLALLNKGHEADLDDDARRILVIGHEALNQVIGGRPTLHYNAALYDIQVSGENGARRATMDRIGTLATREHFAPSAVKKDTERDVRDVIFPGGLPENEQGEVVPLRVVNGMEVHALTTGVSDAATGLLLFGVRQGVMSRVAAKPILQ